MRETGDVEAKPKVPGLNPLTVALVIRLGQRMGSILWAGLLRTAVLRLQIRKETGSSGGRRETLDRPLIT